ncbi:short-chain dehydrogenase [Mycobacterium sp. IS-3022]|nr:short-chain dehydrogenase [Mycobacterium sp. IS-3022]
MSEIRLDGRVAVVTGAGRGLGRTHALLLAARGAQVVVNDFGGAEDTDGSPAHQVVEDIRAAGGTAVADGTDVSTLEGASRIADLAVSTYGRLDVLVNNAGILRDRTLKKISPDEVDAVLAVHLGGTIWMSKAVWPVMTAQGYGRIINTTSAAGLFGNFGQTNYAAAKAGIVGVTKTLALEGARDGIKVNAIEPAARTRMTENLPGSLVASLDPALVAPLVLWLSAEECPATGDVYNVGGGRVAKVFVAQAPGYFAPDLSAEQIRDEWAEITNPARAVVIDDFADELDLLAELLNPDSSRFVAWGGM